MKKTSSNFSTIHTSAKKIVIVSHKYLTQPDDDLVFYLNSNKYSNVLHICHSFTDAPDRKSFFSLYHEGKLVTQATSFDFKKFPEPVIYLKEFFLTFFWVLRSGVIWDAYIGMDGLCMLFGNFLRSFGRVKKTIFWAIDFVPEKRFASRLKNEIYHRINTLGYEQSDEMWDLSPRMAEAREKFLNFPRKKYKQLRLVPYGSWLKRITHISWEKCEQHQAVFLGHMLEKQGVQLILKAIPLIIKKIPDFKLKLIGDGNYRQTLEKLAKALGVSKYCIFLGRVEKHTDIEDIIAHSAVGLAPYMKELDTWSYYADPGKVKTYLACGIPVILTNIPWNAAEIESQKAGIIVNENPAEIAQAIMTVVSNKSTAFFRKNAINYAQNFSYEKMFERIKEYL